MRSLFLAALVACGSAPDPAPVATPAPVAAPVAAPAPVANPHAAASPHGAPPPHGAPAKAISGPTWEGRALEVLQGGGYTYVRVQLGDEWIWIAGPESKVQVGDNLVAPKGAPMKDFSSPTLDRTFASIDFVRTIQVVDAPAPAKAPVQTLPEGLTVAEVWSGRDQLAGKTVAVRGRVVKYAGGILDTNFVHIQDGSGDSQAGTHDLTVTTQGQASVGDTVVVRGPVLLNKDYGMGYRYPVMLEEADLTVE